MLIEKLHHARNGRPRPFNLPVPAIKSSNTMSFARGSYMIPNYLNEQINEWFGHGVLPKIWLSNDEMTTKVFAIYWVGTKIEKGEPLFPRVEWKSES